MIRSAAAIARQERPDEARRSRVDGEGHAAPCLRPGQERVNRAGCSKKRQKKAPRAGLEPATYWLTASRYCRLSYRGVEVLI